MPAIRRLVTLPKKMLPLRLQLFKGLFGAGVVPATAATASVAAAPAPAAAKPAGSAGPLSPAVSAFLDSTDSDGATAVLPKTQYPRTLPLPPAAKKAPVGQGLELPK